MEFHCGRALALANRWTFAQIARASALLWLKSYTEAPAALVLRSVKILALYTAVSNGLDGIDIFIG